MSPRADPPGPSAFHLLPARVHLPQPVHGVREPLTDKHVMHRLRANMRDAPLIAVQADRPLDPAPPVQHVPACQGTGLVHPRLPGSPRPSRHGTHLPLPAIATKTSV